jgi:cobalt-zinc-cadmium resistance protein CzcA
VRLDANLMSLGGLSIGIGMMVDGSIVMVENIFRVLAERPEDDRLEAIERAAREVARPVFFAVLIIVAVFLPLFTLQGVEGKLFGPLAFTTSFAMAGSLMTALIIVPALTTVLLRGKLGHEEPAFVRWLKRGYRPMLAWALAHRRATLASALGLLVSALALSPFLGTEFVPELEEGTMTIRVTMLPTVSLPQALDIGRRLEARLLEYPEVTYALSRIGRAELGGDPEPVSNNEIYVGLRSPAPGRVALAARMTRELGADFPGVLFNFSQPIATRVDELLSGVKAQLAIKIFGDDLRVLADQGRRVETAIRGVRGAADVQVEQIEGESQLVVRADRDAMARYGVNVSDVMNVVQTGVGGVSATEVLEDNRRFDVTVRVASAQRSSAEAIGRLLVAGGGATRIPLSQVAHIGVEEAPPQVSHEQGQRRVVVQCNVRGRDMGGFVAEARREVQRLAPMPQGYHTEWGGQFENQQRAQATLMVVVPMSMLLILLLLYLSFNTVRHSLLVISNVPFAIIGGVFALAASGQYLSVPSAVGFIAVFGIAVLNGVVLVTCINGHYGEGLNAPEAAAQGALQRLRPVLMTASVAMLGLIPLLLSSGVGSEVQRPLATVVVGGLLTSTPMTLLVLPVLYTMFVRRQPRRAVSVGGA